MNHFSIIIIIPNFFFAHFCIYLFQNPDTIIAVLKFKEWGQTTPLKPKHYSLLPPFVFVCKFRLFAWLWPSHDFSIASGGHDVYTILIWYEGLIWEFAIFFFQSLCHKLSSSVISVWSRRRRDGFTLRSKFRKKICEIKFYIFLFSSKKRVRW